MLTTNPFSSGVIEDARFKRQEALVDLANAVVGKK